MDPALIFIAAALALGGGASTSTPAPRHPGRPDPRPDLDLDQVNRHEQKPITIAMLKQSEPPPPADVPPPLGWNRELIRTATAYRTETRGGAGLPLAPIWRSDDAVDTKPGSWVVMRAWIETGYAPVQRENRPRASMYTFVFPAMIGVSPTAEQRPLVSGRLPGNSWPPIDWLNVFPRITIDGRLELFMLYPGRSHTGDERGRDYTLVFEWRVQPSKPPTA